MGQHGRNHLNESFKYRWRSFRSKKGLSLGFDVLMVVAVFLVIHTWNTRGLPQGDAIPALPVNRLDLTSAPTTLPAGTAGVVYFFAPWCSYCRHSIGNLEQMVKEGDLAWARTVALDYSNMAEVRDFVRETGLTLPVLLGDLQTGRDWNIQAFPTYFVIDSNGKIDGRSVGYATWLGLRARVRMAQ